MFYFFIPQYVNLPFIGLLLWEYSDPLSRISSMLYFGNCPLIFFEFIICVHACAGKPSSDFFIFTLDLISFFLTFDCLFFVVETGFIYVGLKLDM